MSSILIIEDHPAFSKALVRLLNEKTDLAVLGVVQSGEQALEELPGLEVDLILIDVSLPNMNGIQLAHEIHDLYPQLLCLMLSGHLTSFHVQRALDAGARGYILKEDTQGIVEGVEQVLKGEIYISNALR